MHVVEILGLLFYSLRLASSYNMQLQANIVVKRDFFKNYLRSSKPASVHFDIEIPPGLATALGYEMNKNLRSGPLGLEEPWARESKHVPRLVDYLIEESNERFQNTIMNFSKKIVKHQHDFDLNSTINATCHHYASKLRQYADDLLKLDPNNQVDKDVVFLDIIQTSNRYIYEETLKCLRSLKDIDSVTSKKDAVQNMSEEIFSTVLLGKIEDFNFICKMMNICRPFPGFTDYLADFFGELSKLPDDKMHTIIMKTMMIFKKKNSEVERILGKNLMKKLDKQLQNVIYDDLSESRKALAAKRKDIFDRYKAKKVSNNTKGFRLFLDMTDKAFELEGKDDVSRHYNIITNALRDWLGGLTVNIEVIELSFMDYVANTLTKRWEHSISKEARALLHIMLDGKPTKRKNEYLIVNGSNYVNNMSVVSNI